MFPAIKVKIRSNFCQYFHETWKCRHRAKKRSGDKTGFRMTTIEDWNVEKSGFVSWLWAFCVSVCPSAYLSACLSVRLSVYLSVCLAKAFLANSHRHKCKTMEVKPWSYGALEVILILMPIRQSVYRIIHYVRMFVFYFRC